MGAEPVEFIPRALWIDRGERLRSEKWSRLGGIKQGCGRGRRAPNGEVIPTTGGLSTENHKLSTGSGWFLAGDPSPYPHNWGPERRGDQCWGRGKVSRALWKTDRWNGRVGSRQSISGPRGRAAGAARAPRAAGPPPARSGLRSDHNHRESWCGPGRPTCRRSRGGRSPSPPE